MVLTVIVAIVVIGPKDLPVALRTAGRWIGKIRRVSGHFSTGVETMIREAELEEMEQKWREQNATIMAESGTSDPAAEPLMEGPFAVPEAEPASAEARTAPLPPPP